MNKKNDGLIGRLFMDLREFTKRAFSETDPVIQLTSCSANGGGCQCVNCQSCNNSCNK